MHKLRLPVGIQALSEMIQGGYYYVDKTPYALQLIDQGKYYFLSRPRRFGKSLFLDTLKELFEGNEPLFQGLFVHDKWDWSRKHPVVRIGFGDGVISNRAQLDTRIDYLLKQNERRLGLPASDAQDIAGRFADLIRNAHTEHQAQVVVLIDEYDKPILDNITRPEAAAEAREGLKNLYSVLKDADPHLRFCLLTGVTKFSKVSLFSGLNNLRDITLSTDYSAICGYTEEDVDRVFAPELPGVERDQLRRWYNGYNWSGKRVYNPFDLLLLFQERQFKPYWFESATPSFLVQLLAERGVYTPQLSALQTDADLLGHFDVEHISTEALLFQTGHLTLKTVEQPVLGMWLYTLSYPNLEVEASLNRALLPAYGVPTHQTPLRVIKLLKDNDFDALSAHFKALFASLPHDWYRNNPIARYEGHYASVFYSHLAALGLQVIVEDASHHGQVDMAITFNGHVYLWEFKVVDDTPKGAALAQLKNKGYADKYRGKGEPIHLIGVEFSKARRQIVVFEVETV